MDLLLSVPVAGYFLGPTTLSSTVNLLFFYMTWSTLVLSHPPLYVHVVGILTIRVFLGLVPGLLSLLLDSAVPSLAEAIKLGGRSALPPRDARSFVRILGLAVVNVLLLTAVEGVCALAFAAAVGRPEFRTSTTLPLPWSVAKHVGLLFLAREVLCFYINRHLLHAEGSVTAVTGYIARSHARFAHARTAPPFVLQLYTDHPLPLLLHRFVPVYLPALALRPHLLTYFLFVTLVTLEEAVSMSGYSVVPGIIMGGIAQRSAIHYASGGEANYGAWGVLDWAHGTGEGKTVLDDVKAEADKHHLQQRSASKARGAVQAIQDALPNGGGSDSSEGPRRTGRKRASKKTKTN